MIFTAHKSITIVIPVKNDEVGIGKCLKSLTELSDVEAIAEIIVIDNGSDDNTLAVAGSFNVKLIVNSKETVAGLRNIGSFMATGDIIGFIDSDCVADKMWITNAIKHFDDEQVACVGSMAKSFERTKLEKAWNEFRTRRKGIQEVGWINSMNMFVRKSAFVELGGFNSSLKTCEDVDLCYRIGEKFKVISDDSVIVFHYGEATKISEFIKKEKWRGYSNLDGIFSHKVKMSELKSLIMPIYFLLTIIFVILNTFFLSNKLLLLTVSIHLIPFVLFLTSRLIHTQCLMALYQTYLMYFYAYARSVALVQRGIDWIRKLIFDL